MRCSTNRQPAPSASEGRPRWRFGLVSKLPPLPMTAPRPLEPAGIAYRRRSRLVVVRLCVRRAPLALQLLHPLARLDAVIAIRAGLLGLLVKAVGHARVAAAPAAFT